MGIGVALGIAAIPTSGLSLVGAVLGGGAGGGVIGEFCHRGLKMTDGDLAHTGHELGDGHGAVGVLTSDFETEAVGGELKELGKTPQTHEVAKTDGRGRLAHGDRGSARPAAASTHMRAPPRGGRRRPLGTEAGL
jgi:hypothetical protein